MDKEQIKFWTAVKEGAAEVKEAAVSSSQHVRADVADVLERILTKGIDKVLLSADSELSGHSGPVGALDVMKICAALPVIIKGLEIASRLPLPKIAAAAAVAVETLSLAQDAFCGGGGLFGAADPETQQAAQAVVDELRKCCPEC